MDIDQFAKLKRKVEDCQRRADKAAGSLDTLRQQLRKEFGCNGLDEAKTVLTRLEKDGAKAERECSKLEAEFLEKYGEMLEGEK